MSYERDEAMRQQEATEAMIQMREQGRSGPHPDPIAGAMAEIRNALRLALQFAEDEVENRESAGGSMSDYINEAQDVADTCRAALKAAANWYVSGLSAEEAISLVVDHLLEKEK